MLLIMASLAAPGNSAAENLRVVMENQRFVSLHRKWWETHQTALRRQESANTLLVVDPGQKGAWIETDGQVDAKDIEPLPAGLEWFAYLITEEGIAEIPFPVRLNRPRFDPTKGDDAEEILIVGFGKMRSWQFSVATAEGGHVMHVGGGSPISTMTWTRRERKSAPRPDERRLSMLVTDGNPPRTWTDSIQNEHVSIRVVRTVDRQ